jgi:hypothetical protein
MASRRQARFAASVSDRRRFVAAWAGSYFLDPAAFVV